MVDDKISELLNMLSCFRYFFFCISITAILPRKKSPLTAHEPVVLSHSQREDQQSPFVEMRLFVLAMNVPVFGLGLNIS